MTPAPLPPDEAARLQTLESLQVLDTPADPVLDGLARAAAWALRCPVALVSLVDRDRQWFKARRGSVPAEAPRDVSLCGHAILGDATFVVPDTWQDPRFADNPAAHGAAPVRFYAGVPLTVDGRRVGTLCVIDHVPRAAGEPGLDILRDLAGAVMAWLRSRQQQLALAARERELAEVFGAMDEGVLLVDAEGRVGRANAAAAALFGRPAPALRTLTLDALLGDAPAAGVVAGDPAAVERGLRREDGSERWLDISQRPLDGGRRLLVLRDVTERRARDDELLRLSAAVEQALESILILDVEGRIEYANAAVLRGTGYAHAELVGHNVGLLRGRSTSAGTWRAIWAGLRQGRSWQGYLFTRRKDGTELAEFAAVAPVRDPAGRVVHYLAVKEDVTEKRRLGEELDRYRDHLEDMVEQRTLELDHARRLAEQANLAKGAFLATMSHEIRTPMNGVLGLVDVLRQTGLTGHQTELVETVQTSAQALLRIIDDILDFSKIEAGRLELERQPFALRTLCESVCDTLQPVAAAARVRLHAFVDPELPHGVQGDGGRLRQVLTNLLGNAIKFSRGLERPGRVSLHVEPDGAQGALFTFTDNGIGMAPEVLGRLFRPFEQGEASTTRRYGGTGLGLVISRRLVEAMGGSIAVASRPGEGSIFTVQLRFEADPQAPAPPVPDLGGLSCRLALDDPSLAADWAAYLRHAGAQVGEAAWPGDGDGAVLIVDAEAQPDLAQAWRARTSRVAVVAVERGQRRRPRLDAPGRVTADLVGLMHRDSLLAAVALAAGRGGAGPAGDEPAADASPPVRLDGSGLHGRRVLVAEDDEVNQAVVGHQLQLLGLPYEIAADGREALQRWRAARSHYWLLLTDLHMPGLDGHGLTAAIRSEEAPGERLPIVALTASALREEADRCLAVGMDARLIKPVSSRRLRETIEPWLPPPAAATAVFDERRRAGLAAQGPVWWLRLRDTFLAGAEEGRVQIGRAVRAGDCHAIADAAHRLKSSSRSLGALSLGDLLSDLEACARAGDLDAARRLAGRVDDEVAAARDWLLGPATLPAA